LVHVDIDEARVHGRIAGVENLAWLRQRTPRDDSRDPLAVDMNVHVAQVIVSDAIEKAPHLDHVSLGRCERNPLRSNLLIDARNSDDFARRRGDEIGLEAKRFVARGSGLTARLEMDLDCAARLDKA
jgi:hypothetical protein